VFHHLTQRVPGAESIPKLIFGFQQMMVGDLNKGEICHVP
jgi:hypothetical protein